MSPLKLKRLGQSTRLVTKAVLRQPSFKRNKRVLSAHTRIDCAHEVVSQDLDHIDDPDECALSQRGQDMNHSLQKCGFNPVPQRRKPLSTRYQDLQKIQEAE